MRADLRAVASGVALGATLASIGYATFAVARLRAFERRVADQARRRARADSPERPAVTILKAVRGVEPGLEANLRSFCEQDYPRFEVVMGVLDPADPALEILRRVAAGVPNRTKVVTGDGVRRFRNPKIATLAPMIGHATGEIVVIADSDMRVTPEYLDAVVAPFADRTVGAVTCIYRGEPAGDDLASALGAMWITEQFAPSALVATALEPLTYCFGGTMAARRDVFDAIGGLAALGDQLADDATLGRLVAERGYAVALAAYVATNVVSEPGLRELHRHELRWARTIRAVRPASYAGLFLTYPLALALAYLALARRRDRALALVGLAALARLALHRAAQAGSRSDRRPSPALIPLRDLLGIAVWARGMQGREVRWRDADLRVTRDGELRAG